ncbi:MAG: thiamine ABC transporter substrate binding subunit [Sphaerochaeta sp.]|nr:thiamine ABC transporter substrate binding subunit [Sphaerochaeta sp.]
MKKHQAVCVLVAILSLLTPITAQGVQEQQELVVYAYDSFSGDWGPGPVLVEMFEEETGIKVNLVSSGDGMEMMNKLISEANNPWADVVVGISDDMASKIYEAGLLEPYKSEVLADIPEFLHFDPTYQLIPFDYGNFAFVVDTEAMDSDMVPKSLASLTDPIYKDKVILIDPRTSSVGLGLLLWTIEVFGEEGYLTWWETMKEQALTITDGWSSAYGLFTEGEAPLVLSYTTSPVYHVTYEDTTRYQVAIFEEGHSTTIEGVGLLESSKKKDEARQFIDFILTKGQLTIAMANSMYPVNSKTELPDAFDYAPKPEKNLSMDSKTLAKNLDRWLTEWTQVMSK